MVWHDNWSTPFDAILKLPVYSLGADPKIAGKFIDLAVELIGVRLRIYGIEYDFLRDQKFCRKGSRALLIPISHIGYKC